jgi:hypothetical protein
MIEHYGQDEVNELFHNAGQVCKFRPFHYADFQDRFRTWDTMVLDGMLPDETDFIEELRYIIGGGV